MTNSSFFCSPKKSACPCGCRWPHAWRETLRHLRHSWAKSKRPHLWLPHALHARALRGTFATSGLCLKHRCGTFHPRGIPSKTSRICMLEKRSDLLEDTSFNFKKFTHSTTSNCYNLTSSCKLWKIQFCAKPSSGQARTEADPTHWKSNFFEEYAPNEKSLKSKMRSLLDRTCNLRTHCWGI